MNNITKEELEFDLVALKELQEKRKATIARLKEAIATENAIYNRKDSIISTLENESEQTDQIEHDLPILINEQRKRLGNVQIIMDAISEEQEAIDYEQEIIATIEAREKS